MQRFAAPGREIHFEKGPIVSALMSYSAPVLLSQLLQQLYNITDCAVVGRFCGEFALAATGLGGLVLATLVNFFIGLSTGIGVLAAQEFGAFRYPPLKKIICTGVNLGLVLGVVLSAAGIFLAEPILSWIHCPAEMHETAGIYLRICFLGLMPQLVYNIGCAILRSLGDTRSPLHYLLLSGMMNVALDLLLVIVFHLGLPGVAAATVLSQWFLLGLISRRLTGMDPEYSYSPTGKMLPVHEFLHMLSVSLPSGMQAVFMSISSLILQVTINSFGPAAVAGMTVYAKLEGFLYYPAFSYGIALTGFVGQNYGARCMERVRESVRLSLIVCTGIMVPLSLLVTAISKTALQLFTTDPEILRNGFEAILWNLPFYFLYMINQIYLGSLKGLGRTGYPMICTLVCYCIFRVVWCSVLTPIFHSMIVVYTSYDASWIILLLMVLPFWRKTLREKEKDCLLHALL